MITLILGGARSGKSVLAEGLAAACGPRVLYVATCVPGDVDLRRRVADHRRRRPRSWRTLEAPLDPAGAVPRSKGGGLDAVLIDCLTLWTFNLFGEEGRSPSGRRRPAHTRERSVLRRIERGLQSLVRRPEPVFLVTNELGCGLVPADAESRAFRDLMGKVNIAAARRAAHVAHVVAGIPTWIRGDGNSCRGLTKGGGES